MNSLMNAKLLNNHPQNSWLVDIEQRVNKCNYMFSSLEETIEMGS